EPDPAARPSMRDVRATLETLVERRGAGDSSHHGRLVPLVPTGGAPGEHEHTMRGPAPTAKTRAARPPAGAARAPPLWGGLAPRVLGGAAALVAARSPERQPSMAAAAERPAEGAARPRAVTPTPLSTAPMRPAVTPTLAPSPAPSIAPSEPSPAASGSP